MINSRSFKSTNKYHDIEQWSKPKEYMGHQSNYQNQRVNNYITHIDSKKDCQSMIKGKCKRGIHCKFNHNVIDKYLTNLQSNKYMQETSPLSEQNINNRNVINENKINHQLNAINKINTQSNIHNMENASCQQNEEEVCIKSKQPIYKINRPCWYQKTGFCKKGNDCEYNHQICRFNQNKKCKYGENCRYIHINKINALSNYSEENHYPSELNATYEYQRICQETDYNKSDNVHTQEYKNIDQSLQIIEQAEAQFNPNQDCNEYMEDYMYVNQYDNNLVNYNNQEMKYGSHNLVNFNDQESRYVQKQKSNFL